MNMSPVVQAILLLWVLIWSWWVLDLLRTIAKNSCPTCRQRRDDAITMNEVRRLRSERDRYREALERIADADENNGFARIKIARQALGLSEFP